MTLLTSERLEPEWGASKETTCTLSKLFQIQVEKYDPSIRTGTPLYIQHMGSQVHYARSPTATVRGGDSDRAAVAAAYTGCGAFIRTCV